MNTIVLFGTGSSSDKVNHLINTETNRVVAYLDNDSKKQGVFKNGVPIYHPSKLVVMKYDFVIICSIYYEDIEKQLLGMGINSQKIINLYRYVRTNDVLFKLLEWERSKNIKILITGMSYSRYGFDTDTLKWNSINLSFNSQDLFYDYCMTRHVLDNSSEGIKYALIGLAYFSFHFNLSLSKEKHLVERYAVLKWRGIKHNQTKFIIGHERMRDLFVDDFLNKFDQLDQNVSFDREKLKKEQKDLAKLHSSKDYPKTVKENKVHLHNLVKLLLSKNITPIFVIHPQAKPYREYFRKDMVDEFHQIVNDFKQKYKIEEVNLFSSQKFTQDDFYDVHHLNTRGAKKVSRILNDYLK
ncbi:nucleoside-diphosphate sugar epimerase/dehydratase [Halobacillus sp. Nhm2S1]|uniref:nucleoside-diphosphate sugar epimerase/dehydratase n=1 Tax=Halobacillus sp. Nhm2S1 TaxID=2866716 RepID=UPI001C72E6C6|nr:hypothetical protein [Halobacillus sp. Nhm2S1]MBX0359451.1 hypothetical protein [Halobacillus sp. Nhm2S1]